MCLTVRERGGLGAVDPVRHIFALQSVESELRVESCYWSSCDWSSLCFINTSVSLHHRVDTLGWSAGGSNADVLCLPPLWFVPTWVNWRRVNCKILYSSLCACLHRMENLLHCSRQCVGLSVALIWRSNNTCCSAAVVRKAHAVLLQSLQSTLETRERPLTFTENQRTKKTIFNSFKISTFTAFQQTLIFMFAFHDFDWYHVKLNKWIIIKPRLYSENKSSFYWIKYERNIVRDVRIESWSILTLIFVLREKSKMRADDGPCQLVKCVCKMLC